MKISEILKLHGLFANDIRQRFNNKQIKLNGEPSVNVDLDVELKINDNGDIDGIITAGDFIFNLISDNPLIIPQLKIFDFETLSESNINNKLTKVLKNYFILRFSKRDVIILTKTI
jgi:hypothetical protein